MPLDCCSCDKTIVKVCAGHQPLGEMDMLCFDCVGSLQVVWTSIAVLLTDLVFKTTS